MSSSISHAYLPTRESPEYLVPTAWSALKKRVQVVAPSKPSGVAYYVPQFFQHIAYRERIDELSRYSKEEDVKINVSSITAFWDFLEELESQETVGLITTHTGNLRAVWETDESYFAVEFHGGDSCECVMWSPATSPASKYCSISESIGEFITILNDEKER